MAVRKNEFGQPIGHPVDRQLPSSAPSTSAMLGRFCTVLPLDPSEHGGALWDAFGDAPDDRDWTYLFGGPFGSVADFGEWLESLTGNPDLVPVVIVDGHGPCGLAAFLRITPMHGVVEVGNIHLSRRLQRTAAATEAMFLMMQRAFGAGYRRYEWKCDALNAPSRAAAERLGFTYEGEFRQAMVYKGRSRDTAWFSIIDEEWPRLRSEFERWLHPANFDEDGQQLTPLRHPTSSAGADGRISGRRDSPPQSSG